MKKVKTRDEKFWDYLSKKVGNTKTAKEIFHKVIKEFSGKPKTIDIKFNVDSNALKEAQKNADKLIGTLSKIKVSK